MIYAKLIRKIINYMFGVEHAIVVTEVWNNESLPKGKKAEVCVYVYADQTFQNKLIGKNRAGTFILLNLLRIKSYLNNHHANLKVELANEK